MSYTEIHTERGMPFGGMPHDELLYKLEETDPELLSDVRGDDPFHDVENDYDDYIRAEIIDRAPDDTFLESDHTRRDPALSRTMLNLRYSGGRGPNDYRLPRHPELFIGFTGNDPRGVDTQPRLDKIRAHTEARARQREVRMGHNVGHGDFIEADRPWGGRRMEYDKKDMQRRLKKRMRWFPAQKVGRPWGRNVVADGHYGLHQRREVVASGGESLFVPEQHHGVGVGGYDPVRGAESTAPRRVDAPGADRAFWRNTLGDTDLAVSRYTSAPGGGRETFGPGAAGGALAQTSRADQDFGAQTRGATPRRTIVAEGMTAAAAHRRAAARNKGGDSDYGASTAAGPRGKTAPELARDVARAVYDTRADQDFRPAGQLQDHEGGALGAGAGLGLPSRAPQSAWMSTRQGQPATANSRLANVDAMVRSLKGATASEIRGVQGAGLASGPMGTATSGIATGDDGLPGAGLLPAADYTATLKLGEAPLARAAAAAGLEVQNYSGLVPGAAFDPVTYAQAGGFASARKVFRGRTVGQSKAPEFYGHTGAPVTLGDSTHRTFGNIGEGAPAPVSYVSAGGKTVRSTTLGDHGDDVLSRNGFNGGA